MKTILYSCVFVPGEWIAAYGFRPFRATPPSCGLGAREGLCPYVRALAHMVSTVEGEAVVLTTLCDQMRRAEDLITEDSDKPIFLMHVPAAWQSPGVFDYYVDELRRLGEFLSDIGGMYQGQAALAKTMKEYERERSISAGDNPPGRDNEKRLAFVGGELLREDLVIFDLVRQAGGRVVLDATDRGPRGLPRPFREDRMAEDPLRELADAYFGTIPHAFRRPNEALYRYLSDHLAACQVKGILFRHYPWCDTWNAERFRLRTRTRLPVLDLDTRGEGGDTNRLAGRIQAFLETIP